MIVQRLICTNEPQKQNATKCRKFLLDCKSLVSTIDPDDSGCRLPLWDCVWKYINSVVATRIIHGYQGKDLGSSQGQVTVLIELSWLSKRLWVRGHWTTWCLTSVNSVDEGDFLAQAHSSVMSILTVSSLWARCRFAANLSLCFALLKNYLWDENLD